MYPLSRPLISRRKTKPVIPDWVHGAIDIGSRREPNRERRDLILSGEAETLFRGSIFHSTPSPKMIVTNVFFS